MLIVLLCAASAHAGFPVPPSADFDRNGVVGWPDFGLFAGVFGTQCIGADLDRDGMVGFPDFTIFIESFGEREEEETVDE